MKGNMIYLNQAGHCELGRGETLEQALASANACGFAVVPHEIKTESENLVDGDVYQTSIPNVDYNFQ